MQALQFLSNTPKENGLGLAWLGWVGGNQENYRKGAAWHFTPKLEFKYQHKKILTIHKDN